MSLTKRKLIDLSVTLDNDPNTDPPPLLPKIDYMDHQESWPEMAAMFPGLKTEDLPGEESWASERLEINHPQWHAHGCALALRVDHRLPRCHHF